MRIRQNPCLSLSLPGLNPVDGIGYVKDGTQQSIGTQCRVKFSRFTKYVSYLQLE